MIGRRGPYILIRGLGIICIDPMFSRALVRYWLPLLSMILGSLPALPSLARLDLGFIDHEARIWLYIYRLGLLSHCSSTLCVATERKARLGDMLSDSVWVAGKVAIAVEDERLRTRRLRKRVQGEVRF